MLNFYRFSHFEKYTTLLHAVSEKSTNRPYFFSLALHTGEDVQSIISNRMALSNTLEKECDPLYFIVAQQTHSDHIKVIKKSVTRGWNSLSDAIEECDALVTNIPHVLLTILTADCVPILLFDPKQEVVAAVHAGWRGSKAEIVKKTVQKMTEIFGCNPSNIKAGIAPAIGGCCYEVGKEVAKHFFHMPNAYQQKKEKYMLDLPSVNKIQLLKSGLKEENIEISAICTACDENYFSYRREGETGRFAGFIMLK